MSLRGLQRRGNLLTEAISPDTGISVSKATGGFLLTNKAEGKGYGLVFLS